MGLWEGCLNKEADSVGELLLPRLFFLSASYAWNVNCSSHFGGLEMTLRKGGRYLLRTMSLNLRG